MQILSLLVALLGTTLLSAEAAEQGHRMVKARRTASSLARRHADYTGHKLVKRAYSGRATFFDGELVLSCLVPDQKAEAIDRPPSSRTLSAPMGFLFRVQGQGLIRLLSDSWIGRLRMV